VTEPNDEKLIPLEYRPAPPESVPMGRRVWARVLGYSAIVVVVLGLSTMNSSAIANCTLFAFALGIGAVLVRYGNVRL
jgi:hypothetical protein